MPLDLGVMGVTTFEGDIQRDFSVSIVLLLSHENTFIHDF